MWFDKITFNSRENARQYQDDPGESVEHREGGRIACWWNPGHEEYLPQYHDQWDADIQIFPSAVESCSLWLEKVRDLIDETVTDLDGGGTLWRWVYHCQARIVADLNKPVLNVTATPANLKKLEWVIRQMFKVVQLEASFNIHRTAKMPNLTLVYYEHLESSTQVISYL